jgi:hypothetical protein
MTKPVILRRPDMVGPVEADGDGESREPEDGGPDPSDQVDWDDEPKGSRGKVYKSISGALWSLTVVAYLAVSFLTQGWSFTWLIFLLAVAVDNIIKAIFDIRL